MPKTKIEDSRHFAWYQSILRAGFDHIITTNYTYELEQAAYPEKTLSTNKIKKMQKSTKWITVEE